MTQIDAQRENEMTAAKTHTETEESMRECWDSISQNFRRQQRMRQKVSDKTTTKRFPTIKETNPHAQEAGKPQSRKGPLQPSHTRAAKSMIFNPREEKRQRLS